VKVKPRILAPVSAPESFPVVGIGASAGGLEAFSELLARLPEKTGMAYVLIQHLDPKHHSDLRDILERTTKIPVHEVADGVVVQPEHIYVIPPNVTMVLKNGKLRLDARVLTRGRHLPLDLFLRSLAEERGNRAIGVILSGTASDGTEGARAIKAAGGIMLAQDEKSAKYAGMPHNAVSSGCIDFVMPPAAIAEELVRLGQRSYLSAEPKADPASGPRLMTTDMEFLLALLRDATGVDFTHYKQTTLQRRIRRRMVEHKLEKLKDYVHYVRQNPREVEDLYQDILIHVTGFFRDPEAFEALRQEVFPYLFHKKRKDTVRVWVPGCSSGEEVYSLAMAMLEYLWLETTKTAKAPLGYVPFQIFATDISERSLDLARAGIYSEASLAEVPQARVKRFFVQIDGGYQIVKAVREMCIFARQNVTKDPPFSHLDLVSCRNLLIYLGPVLQQRVIPTLHYALKPSGYLLLGSAESLGTFASYFSSADKKNKIYQKKNSSTRPPTYFGGLDLGERKAAEELKSSQQPHTTFTVEKEMDRLLFSRFVPASIVVNDAMEIIQIRGKTGPYLEPASGSPTFSLAKMAREGLLLDLRAAIVKAKRENDTVRREGVRVRANDGARTVNLEVCPLRGSAADGRFYLVVFEDAAPQAPKRQESKAKTRAQNASSGENQGLRRELARVREQFQDLIEDHESTTQEFSAANKEILSANEELQSTNEELETAKEELQSTNEELTTLNEELQNRNLELTATNNDLLNVLGNVNIPMVIVDNDLRIRRFTPPAQKLLNLLPGDIGRRLTQIRPNLVMHDLGPIAREAIEKATLRELEVRESDDGAWHMLRVRPYKTWDNRIDGAVLSFEDINAIKRDLDQTRLYADALVEHAREIILILDSNLRVIRANPAFYRKFNVAYSDTANRAIYELGSGQWNIPKLRELLEKILPDNETVEDLEVRHEFPGLGMRIMLVNARRIELQPGKPVILLYVEDVTGKAEAS
jgi:two-component system CheB/CheR fusion protein